MNSENLGMQEQGATWKARRAALDGKYDVVQARMNQLLKGTPNAAGASTGVARIIAGEYKVVVSSLNVRIKPSLSGAVVASYDRGDRIYSIADNTVAADEYVWTHYTTHSGAIHYAAVGARQMGARSVWRKRRRAHTAH